MKLLDKSNKLNHVSYEVRGPVLEEADKMIAAGEHVLKLNIGNPAVFGFSAPAPLLDEVAQHVASSQAYSASKGIAAACKAIAAYCATKGIPNVTEEDIYTGNGASDLISIALQALLDTGDEILIPAPDYPLWTAAATLAGGKVVHYLCDEQADWSPDIADMKKKITPRTKAIVVINPNNPTGALYEEAVLLEIAEVARQNGLLIFADEIYDRVVMDGYSHTSIASLAPDLFCITFNGLSKSHIVCGFRAGWMCLSGDKSRAQGYIEGINMLASMRLCANVPAQYAIPIALEDKGPNPHYMPGGRLYEQNKYIYEALNSIPGVSAVKPKASLYIFPKLDSRFHIVDDQKFALDFLHQEKVLVVQGTGFNWIAPDHFRIVFLPALHDLQAAMEKLARFLHTYRQ
ncbi:pyridoxal phosphate-dependent aminotransferase [Christensenellaceae bacterium OttesenSCG-928-L17]|nr:pyridoxal phosphate-dependent aminotransferase [Christensenellaceae bacterium OttesenSCG-928-L17]